MPAAQHRQGKLLEHLALADDDLVHLVEQGGAGGGEARHQLRLPRLLRYGGACRSRPPGRLGRTGLGLPDQRRIRLGSRFAGHVLVLRRDNVAGRML